MQRTAVIYGLALSTLVGAFLLAPRLTPEPVPDPVPTPSALAPVTQLVYSDGVLEVTARLDRGYLARGIDEPVWMDVAVKASGIQQRAPLTAILVVDRSGSMAGDKIDAARLAAERLEHGLRDGDALGVITFGTDVTVEFPVATIDSSTRARALAVVRRIEEGGGTNIDGGMSAARHMLKSADLEGRVGRVVLLSDGRPTEGDRRESTLVGHADELRTHGIVTSTLGLGLDYNEDLMEHIAVAGGGRYHYMRHGAQLAQILSDELEQASAVVASGTVLHLPQTIAGLRVLDVPGARVSTGAGNWVAVDIGDLAAGEERHALVKLQVIATENVVTLPAPEVVYRKIVAKADALVANKADPFRLLVTTDVAQLDASRRDDVRVRVLQMEASLALTESMTQYASGNASGARASLARQQAELRKVAAATKSHALAAEAANFDKVLDVVNAAPSAASESSQDMIKNQKARAFQLRR
jgi:Ca-activated chloride channel family protein